MWWTKDDKQGNNKRILKLIESTASLEWAEKSEQSLQTLYGECIEFIRKEVEYYDDKRNKMRRASSIFRGLGLTFGTIGFLLPLISHADLACLRDWGYPMLVLSTAIFTANNLFGGTSGHTRYVKAQLQLERWLTLTVIEWNRLSNETGPFTEIKVQNNAQNKPEEVTVEIDKNQAKFNFLMGAITEAYEIVLSETDEWSYALKDAMADYQSKIGKGNSP